MANRAKAIGFSGIVARRFIGLRLFVIRWGCAVIIVAVALCIAVFIAPVAAMPTASMHEKMHADEAAEQHNQYPVFQNPLHGRLSFSKHEYLSSVLSKTPPVTPHYRIFKMSCVAIGLRLSE
uniref:hypothetical protein n=1 Tax=Yoonia sp. TaxID=2212373 RepID=UPI004048E09A